MLVRQVTYPDLKLYYQIYDLLLPYALYKITRSIYIIDDNRKWNNKQRYKRQVEYTPQRELRFLNYNKII